MPLSYFHNAIFYTDKIMYSNQYKTPLPTKRYFDISYTQK